MAKVQCIREIRSMFDYSVTYVGSGYSPVSYVIQAGCAPSVATKLIAICTVLLAGLLLYLWRQAPIITHFAIASVAARFWTYHSNYDNVIVAFLLLALGYLAWNRKSMILWAAFLLVGLSLWLPAKFTDHGVFRLFQMFIWPVCLSILLFQQRNYLTTIHPRLKTE
jgi:hypothetical protein